MDKSNQALQTKYPHLEVSVLKLSEVKKDNESFRIDSEYFEKEYLENEEKIVKIGFMELEKLSKQITDFGAYSQTNFIDFVSSGVLFLRNQDIKETFVDLGNNVFITQEIFNKLTLKLQELDIVIPRVGTLGNAAIIEKTHLPCSANQNLAVIRLKNEINPYFVTLFLCSFNGKQQIFRTSTGNVQQWLNLATIGRIKIPIFPMPFQLEIEKLVKDSHKALESSKALYKEAEALLYEALGLDSKNPLQSILESKITDYHDLQGKSCDDNALNPNYTIATLKESFLKTGRLDAEYYQSKYEDIERFIKNYKGGYVRLADIGEVVNGSFIPEAFYTQKAQRAYIRIKELSLNMPIKISECIYIKDDFIASNEVVVKENDFVVATIGNTIGKVNLVPKELEGSFISNNTSRFRLIDKNYIPEFMELLLRSMFVQEQIQRNFTQTAQPKISNTSIENILIPKIDSTTQTQIAAHIQKSFELRAEAKSLLESAKQRVEEAIVSKKI
ncbi:MAG TPA: restriction endonuclease subunit S [Campylobacter avium]|uniref:restriction endonuclease subunit S n=1 Tax=Campylobacter avium TaxID=522485 RepID=UPI001DBFFA8B|nr:restriction endonuclease subunit S [Campylobacter avium]HJE65602.1 restriction endonuclease subunit S [Campylobacter avium]